MQNKLEFIFISEVQSNFSNGERYEKSSEIPNDSLDFV